MQHKNNQSLYLKKIGHQGDLNFYLVDGALIRQKIDKDFTNFGQHYRFSFIPEYECWLDKEAALDERKFFISHLLVEWRLQRAGCSYNEAIDRADTKERAERSKSKYLKKFKNQDGHLSPKKVHLRLLKKAGLISIWLVNGRLVRDAYNIDFTEGGHDLVYNFVPKNEVWLDNDVVPYERKIIIFHELYERNLMSQGYTYNKAHGATLKKEETVRYDKTALNLELKKLAY